MMLVEGTLLRDTTTRINYFYDADMVQNGADENVATEVFDSLGGGALYQVTTQGKNEAGTVIWIKTVATRVKPAWVP